MLFKGRWGMATVLSGATIALVGSLMLGCSDMSSPDDNAVAGLGPQTPRSDAVAPTNECATPGAGWIFCDDFESDRTGKYFEYDNSNGKFVRTPGAGANGSIGMRATYTAGQSAAGSLKLAFGRTPDPYFRPADAGTANYREVYWRFYVQRGAGWVGNGPDKLTRATIFAKSDWSEAMIAHGWSGGASNTYMMVDPASGTDASGNLQAAGYNDFGHLRWLGSVQSAAPEQDQAHVGRWACYEYHVKLNDAGQSNGVFEFSVDGQPSARKTGLNWVGSYNAYGMNAVFLEQFVNAGAPAANVRTLDNFVVSTRPIGCGSSTPTQGSVATVSVSVNPTSIGVGQTAHATATMRDASGASLSGRAVSWSSSDTTIAKIDASGEVTGAKAGTANITGTSEGKSGSTSITVGTAQAAAGLVAAYGFNEGSGAVSNDVSSFHNTAQLGSGVTRVAGKFGGGLLFNGSGMVTIADAPSLRLTTSMTLEAWVDPSVVDANWRDVIYKGNDNYYLMATSGTSGGSSAVPSGGASFGNTSATVEAYAPSKLPTSTWTHLAVTYDGSTIRLYVNGSQVATRAKSGSFTTSSNPLHIGGNEFYPQFYRGVIDEVRLYNRPLSAKEIQSDMNTPIGGGSSTVPPTNPVNATQIAITRQPSTSAQSGVAFAQQPTVQLRDAAGTAVAQAGVTTTASIASGGGLLGGSTTATTDASGTATFSDLKITGTAGSRTLRFAAGSMTATSTAIAVTAGSTTTPTATKLVVSNIGNQVAGTPFNVTVTLADANNNPVNNTGASATVTLSRQSGTGTLGGTVSGQIAVGASSVTIGGVTYSTAESGVVLRATASGTSSSANGKIGSSNGFTVGTAAGSGNTGGGSSVAPTILEDFSTYSSTANFLSNPRGIWKMGVDGSGTDHIVLDQNVGYGASSKSMRYDWPNNASKDQNTTIHPGFLYFPGNLTHVWVEFVVRFNQNFAVNAGWPGGAEYKLAAMGSYFGSTGRWNVPEMQEYQFVSGWPGNEAGFITGPTPKSLWDGQPHVFRVEAKLGPNGIFKLWIDGTLRVNQSGFVTDPSHKVIDCFGPGLNLNQGPNFAGMQMWWHKIAMWSNDPGWK